MRIVGIIAEYNPFHNGHAYQLQMAKAASGAEFAVAVMSGDFVQRGEPAMFNKHLRAKWALQNGADMVIALPTPFSLASAEAFALGGVNMLSKSGIVDSLSFGSECGDAELLKDAARILNDEPEELKAALRANLNSGLSYPDARSRAWDSVLGKKYSRLLSSPNDILGIEYLRAMEALNAMLKPFPIIRKGAAHDSDAVSGGFAGASYIRSAIKTSDSITGLLPDDVLNDISITIGGGSAPVTLDGLSSAAVYALRRMTKEQLSALSDVSEGLENLLYAACRETGDIQRVLEKVKSRRYTMARLKRIAMCALLGIYGEPKDKLDSMYIRVLGIKKEASCLLSELSKRSSLPVVTRYSDADKLNAGQRRMFELDIFASETAALGTVPPSPARFDYSSPLIIV